MSKLLHNKILVGHSVDNDLRVLKLKHPRHWILLSVGVNMVYKFQYDLLVGWRKKYGDLLRKTREYKGEEVEKWGESGNWRCTLGKNMILRKGVEQKDPFLEKYTPLVVKEKRYPLPFCHLGSQK